MGLEAFVYSRDEARKYFDPFFHKKFVFELERKVLVRSLGEEVLVRVYKLSKLYLGIVFMDGLVRDGLTVIRERRRDGYYPVGYIDEVGHKEVLSQSVKGVFMKVAHLKRFRDLSDIPVKTDNTDPLEAGSYWRLEGVFYRNDSYQEELSPFLVLRTRRGEIQISLLRRTGRDNIDLYITERPDEEKLLVLGKAGEVYLAMRGTIPRVANLEETFYFLKRVHEDYGIEGAVVLDENTFTLTGLSSHPILSEIKGKMA
jgi:hypothetical protein